MVGRRLGVLRARRGGRHARVERRAAGHSAVGGQRERAGEAAAGARGRQPARQAGVVWSEEEDEREKSWNIFEYAFLGLILGGPVCGSDF